MRRKIWSDREVQNAGRETETAGNLAPVDRMQDLLALIDGGEGGGGTPCSVGVPPWFLAAAHDRLAAMTSGTEHAGTVDAVFGGSGLQDTVAPDKVALALAAIDENFRAEMRALGAAEA